MENTYKFGTMLEVVHLTADPATAENGSIYYNSVTNAFRMYRNGAWLSTTTGTISVIGQVLSQYAVWIGDAGGLAASIDTFAQGDIAAGVGGLNIKALAINNSQIANNALIARSKTASGNAHRLVVNDALGVMSDLSALTASRAIATDADGMPVASATTATELGYVSGLTSAIQTQINSKLNLAGGTMTGAIAMGGFGITGLLDPVLAQDAGTKNYINNQDALKLNLTGGTMSGAIAMGGSGITGLLDPVLAQDAATKNYVNNQDALKLNLTGGTMSGAIAMGTNKITGLGNGTTSTDAVNKGQLDAAIAGLSWGNPILDSHLQSDNLTAPPGSPNIEDLILVGASATGAFTGLEGRVLRYNGATWVDQLGRVVAIGDRFGVVFTVGVASGGLTGYDDYIVTLTNATPGSYAYTFTAPVDKNAVFVSNSQSVENGHSYTYNGTLTDWVEFAGPSALNAGNGLYWTGSTLHIAFGAGIAQLPTDEVGIDFKSDGGLWLIDPATGLASTATDAQIAIKIDGSTLSKTASGLKVAALGVTNSEIATAAGIAFSKMAALTANKALASNGAGVVIATTVTDTELGYLSGVTSSIQTQINSLSSGGANTTLSNLGTTAINANLIPAADVTINAGSSAKNYLGLFVQKIWGSAPAGASSTWTLSDSGTAIDLNTYVANRDVTANVSGSGAIKFISTGTGNVVAKTSAGLVIQNQTAGSALIATLVATLAASQVTFVTVSTALNFLASAVKSKIIQYEIVDSVTGSCRTGLLKIAVGTVASGEVGYTDSFASSNTALDAIEFLPVVNTGTGNCDIQFKGTGANACSFKVIENSMSVNNNLF